MPTSTYVALSAQVALDRRLTTIANNVANMNTAGFRAEEVKFDAVMTRAGTDKVAFSSPGDTYISRNPGSVSYTGNSLDVAVQGDGWLALSTPDGTVYTRDGRLQMTATGELLSTAGYPVLDPGEAGILLDPRGSEISIAGDGTISQGGNQVGAIGLFSIPETAKLSRYENSGVIPSEAAQPVEDMTVNGLRQGYVEGANVNPISEISKLIMLQRAFDSAASAVEKSESTQQEAIRSLGPS
ncbi:flagellar basal-body rod protein FlgF [Afifella marina]|uniref:Flagellar basal-body rod protein FlgF n=2 Tax=Hyphomicrobiales TaxID=356 RepID=A0A1G5MW62_AFIMA|nr:flagellar basal-body rod protein FlgF [Afifella marina]MBK1622026.1 flagellar basal-body rod protein FlgF [Afifella marina DSM 2698]MBK1627819.1 flagellar basal-body rod protein FlgF [Afifella marina]MBK5916786.1 flagellar basal-body rod protein FlgF [Afifella marina]RAI19888.1 flagellar basal-body rod protein FlgF [Afifella marina DSM 2698]SCZ28868.1 flagellar basal-body rod protein FlgF [Afifella marina DSM 2698]